jgi:DNA modification methylase
MRRKPDSRAFSTDLMKGEGGAKYKMKVNTSHAQMLDFARKHNIKDKIVKPEECDNSCGISIFDPVLCELVYRWFSPPDGKIIDPFSGGSVRGIVASILGRYYTGVDLREEQIYANREQGDIICKSHLPIWHCGDSQNITDIAPGNYDLIFSCPPYADLEVYSDNPFDLSTMPYPEFSSTLGKIIKESVSLLKDNRFAVFVIGEVRGKDGNYYGFVPDVIRHFEDAGMKYYNEAILITQVGSLPIRAGKAFTATRKLGKTHQNVLVFIKGDPKKAADEIGEVQFGDIEDTTGTEPVRING